METLIGQLNEAGVRYLAIGGQAVRLHGLPRFSMDWDLWIPPRDLGNLERLNEALSPWMEERVEPLGPKGENFIQTFQTSLGIVQFHLMVPGMDLFEAAEAAAVRIPMEDEVQCRVLSLPDLLRTKLAAGRPQDQVDVDFLRERIRMLNHG
ncbi:MAG: hypothetical protein EOL90_06910 [Spartobacteria bacterium]|nr:hypothetical protein [Spartobacteria bacterium]